MAPAAATPPAQVRMLRLEQLNRPGQVVSVYRTFYAPGQRFGLHRHDFPELFYIESGRGAQCIGSRRDALRAGDLGFVDPDCAHALEADPGAAMVLTNIAFSRRFLAGLRPYAPRGAWPFEPGRAPVRPLAEAEQAFVCGWIDRLADGAGRADLAVFVLDLLRRLGRGGIARTNGPAWLADAVAHLDRPEVLAKGVRGVATLCGRGEAAVGRAVRSAFGCTTIALINRRRMDWLARELRLTSRPIAELAEACGLPNLSHCYARFRAAHGCPPNAYRRRFQVTVDG